MARRPLIQAIKPDQKSIAGRRRLVKPEAPPKAAKARSVKFVTSGSRMFDLMLGGGWAQGRIINLVGDKSSGKTLLAIEACINWKQTAGVGSIRYAEAEAAFDEDYARSLGMPEGVAFAQVHTVEQFYLDLEGWLDTQVSGKPCLYILDSLDSLSDDKEMAQEIGAPSYGALKAKRMSETFRKLTQKIESSNCTLFVISQIRDKIGVTFGETKTRSGGKALDFYASQIVWLAELQKIKKTSRGIERTIGTRVLARTKKNKVGMPYRDCELAIIFGYGVDDEESMISWITKNKAESLMPDGLTTKQAREDIKDAREVKDRETVDAINRLLFQVVETRWKQVEHDIAPRMSKYAD